MHSLRLASLLTLATLTPAAWAQETPAAALADFEALTGALQGALPSQLVQDWGTPTPDGVGYPALAQENALPIPANPVPAHPPAVSERLQGQAHHEVQPLEQMHYAALDAGIWALGKDYKAFAGPDGFQFIPFLGSDAPRNFPVRFELDNVQFGSRSLDLGQGGTVTRSADRITIARPNAEAWYDMEWDQVKQSFAFDLLPSDQELVLQIAVESELSVGELPNGLRFQNDRGGLDYTQALVYDATGQERSIPIGWVQGKIELRVPADFMAQAQSPIVVDPIVRTYQIHGEFQKDSVSPDVAYDLDANEFAYVHVSVFSATDRDILVQTWGATSDTAKELAWVEISGADWFNPAIANDNASDTYLVVNLVDVGGQNEVWGTSVAAGTLETSSSVLIGSVSNNALPWSNASLDVGGNSFHHSLFKVVWAREFPTLGYNGIRTANVTPAPANNPILPPIVGVTETIDGSGSVSSSKPKISKSTGESDNAEWRVVWITVEPGSGTQHIRGTRFDSQGFILTPPWELGGSIPDGFELLSLDVSDGLSRLEGPFFGDSVYCLATTFETAFGSSIFLYAVERDTLIGGMVLAAHEHQDPAQDQGLPAIASLRDRFVVSYKELKDGQFTTNVTTLDFTNQSLFGINERRMVVATNGPQNTVFAPGAASRFSGGWYASRLHVCASEVYNGANWLVRGTRLSSHDPQTPGVQYCLGNPNSTGDYGFITMHGSANDHSTKVLKASGLPQNQFAYFLAGDGGFGTVQPVGSAGVLCLVGAGIGRYNQGAEVQFTGSSGEISLMIDPEALRHPGGSVAAMAGQTWNFQAWHRENGGSSNFTNAISVVFE